MSIRTLDRGRGSDRPARSPWLTFVVCAGAAYVTTLDLSIVNVAFPEILSEFEGTTPAQVSWIVTVYNIFFGSFLVVAGKIADQIGRKRVFLGGVCVFALGSVICSVSPSLGVLVAGRAVQGLGGAFLAPASLGLLLAAFPLERRTQTVALWGGIGALGVASGPSIGALLISLTDWRAAFWINLPVCAAVLLVGAIVLIETPRVSTAQRPDYGGALMITAALALLALGLSQSDTWGWGDVRTVGSLAAGALLIVAFFRRQRVHPEPVLDLSLFDSPSFRVANLASLAFFAGFAAFGLNGVLFLRGVWGYSVLEAGLLTAIAPLTVAVLAPFAGRFAVRRGFRAFVVIGPLLVATATLLSRTVLGTTPEPLTLVLLNEISAVGIAAFIPVNAAAAVSDLPPMRLSVGGAVSNTSRQVGSVLGVALLVSLIAVGGDAAELLDGHRRGWMLIAVASITASLISALQPARSEPRDRMPQPAPTIEPRRASPLP